MSEEKIIQHWHLGRALFGLVLMFIGLVYIGVYLGIFDWVVWANIWRLWPLLLVGVGLGMIVQRKFSALGVLFVFLILVVFGFWMLWQQSTFSTTGHVVSRDVQEALLEGIEQGELSIDLPSGDIRLSGPADAGVFAYGRVETRSIEHVLDTHVSGSTQQLVIKPTGIRQAFLGNNAFVELQLSQYIPYDISLDVGKADITLDFTSVAVTNLDIDTGASTLDITFGDKVEHADVRIDAGASTIALKAPEGVGVRIITDTGVASTSIEGLEKEDDDTFATPEYASAEKTISISISAGVSTISFSR